ncbi:MAG: hypothetical protein HY326_12310 [Chloroflexi bacterium]|nr:hypothetical protein [Chloroflexota bacterium]
MTMNSGRLALFLFVAAWAIYLLTASNKLQIGSDESVVFATTESLVKHGHFNIDQLASMGQGEIFIGGMWGQDGRQYGKYGPAQALLAMPLYWLAHRVPGLAPIDTVLLFNGLISAATVAALFWASIELGFSATAAVLAAGLYGFGTFAWVYSKSFFGEPLSALALLVAVIFTVCLRQNRRWSDAAFSGACLGLAIGVKWSNGILIPMALGFIALICCQGAFHKINRMQEIKSHLGLMLVWLIPIMVSSALLLLFNWARFGVLWESGYGSDPGFTTPWFYGIWGLLMSPGKSWFLYSPLLLLAIPGAWQMWQRDRAVTVLLAGAILAQILLYAHWWAWWGGWGWGPRLLLPATPLMVLFSLPLLEKLAQSRFRKWQAGLLVGLIAISVAIQVEGVAVHYATYLGDQSQHDPAVNGPTVEDWRQSPLMAQWGYLRPRNLDFSWIYRVGSNGQSGVTFDWLHLCANLVFASLALAGLWWSWRAGTTGGAILQPWLLLFCGIVVAVFGLYRSSRIQDSAYQAIGSYLKDNPADLVVFSDYARQDLFWNSQKRLDHVIGAPESPALTSRLQFKLTTALVKVADGGGTVVQMAANPPGDPDSGVERWLATNYYPAGHEWFGDTRLVPFLVPPAKPKIDTGRPGVRFGNLAILDRYELRYTANALYLGLIWRALAASATAYSVSIQLLDGQGKLITQHDSEPAGATQPTTTWKMGQEIVDRHGLLYTAGPQARLMVIVYDAATGRRLEISALDGQQLGENFTLATLQ